MSREGAQEGRADCDSLLEWDSPQNRGPVQGTGGLEVTEGKGLVGAGDHEGAFVHQCGVWSEGNTLAMALDQGAWLMFLSLIQCTFEVGNV